MSKRLFFALIGIFTLIIGGLIYLLSREGMYITRPFEDIVFLQNIKSQLSDSPLAWISYYLPDYLWAFSLCCELVSIFHQRLSDVLFCAIATFISGLIWEIMQYIDAVQGTGDVLDIIIYLLAAMAVIIIFITKEKKDEKTT